MNILEPEKILKKIQKLFKKFLKLSIWEKLLIIIIIIMPLFLLNKKPEGFSQKKEFVLKENNDIYDDFYCSIYDDLVYDEVKNDFEVKTIEKYIKPTKKSKILDIGCGTGHHVNFYNSQNIKCEGLDKSKSMIDICKKQYPNSQFKQGDALDSMLYIPNSISHIFCLYFTIYHIKNKSLFFENCFRWLKPGGVLLLHLVNRDNFDPIINASDPLTIVSAQKYAKKRITNSVVKFNDFLYRANFKYNKGSNEAHFIETFKDDATGNIRKNDNTIYMDSQSEILSLAKNVGFIMKAQLDMVHCQYEYQYLYILYKPQ